MLWVAFIHCMILRRGNLRLIILILILIVKSCANTRTNSKILRKNKLKLRKVAKQDRKLYRKKYLQLWILINLN